MDLGQHSYTILLIGNFRVKRTKVTYLKQQAIMKWRFWEIHISAIAIHSFTHAGISLPFGSGSSLPSGIFRQKSRSKSSKTVSTKQLKDVRSKTPSRRRAKPWALQDDKIKQRTRSKTRKQRSRTPPAQQHTKKQRRSSSSASQASHQTSKSSNSSKAKTPQLTAPAQAPNVEVRRRAPPGQLSPYPTPTEHHTGFPIKFPTTSYNTPYSTGNQPSHSQLISGPPTQFIGPQSAFRTPLQQVRPSTKHTHAHTLPPSIQPTQAPQPQSQTTVSARSGARHDPSTTNSTTANITSTAIATLQTPIATSQAPTAPPPQAQPPRPPSTTQTSPSRFLPESKQPTTSRQDGTAYGTRQMGWRTTDSRKSCSIHWTSSKTNRTNHTAARIQADIHRIHSRSNQHSRHSHTITTSSSWHSEVPTSEG